MKTEAKSQKTAKQVKSKRTTISTTILLLQLSSFSIISSFKHLINEFLSSSLPYIIDLKVESTRQTTN